MLRVSPVFGWIAVISCAGLADAGDQATDVSPAHFTVSRETTFVTESLLPDGYPDFATAINQRLSDGVTEENNAAVPLLLAIGPYTTQIDMHDFRWGPDQVAGLQQQVGLPAEFLKQSDLQRLRPTTDQRQHFQEYEHPDQRFDEVFRLLRGAAGRTRFYEPLITVAKPRVQPQVLLGAAYPNDFAIENAAQLLLTRATAVKDREEAWKDILASYRLGRLISAGPEVSDGLLGYRIENKSIEAATKFLTQFPPSAAKTRQYLSDLENLPQRTPIRSKVALAERCKCLDVLLYLPSYARHDGKNANASWASYPGGIPGVGHGLGVVYGLIHEQQLAGKNWDPALRQVNEDFDQAARVLGLANAARRNTAIAELKTTWETRRLRVPPADRGEFYSIPVWEHDQVLFKERTETLKWLEREIETNMKANLQDAVFTAAGHAASGMVLPACIRAFEIEKETERSAQKLRMDLVETE